MPASKGGVRGYKIRGPLSLKGDKLWSFSRLRSASRVARTQGSSSYPSPFGDFSASSAAQSGHCSPCLDRTFAGWIALAAAHLFDHLIGKGMHLEGNLKAKCLCGFQVEHEIELGWLQNRQVGRLLAFENAAHIASGLTE